MAETHVSPSDKQNFISLPLVASAFGKRKFNISPFKAAIQSDVEILQMLGPSRPDDIHLGLAKRLEKFISNIAKRVESGESYESYSPILEMMCRAYNPGWLLMARWHMETGKSIDLAKAKEELNRYLENDPVGSSTAEAWFMLGKVCRLTDDTLGEIHAFIERSQINSVPFYDIKSTENLLNRSLHTLDLDQEVKRQLAQRLLTVLEKQQKEASADDLSRMAWLALHIGQDSKAQEYAKAGMIMDSDNDHCYKVCEQLGINNSN